MLHGNPKYNILCLSHRIVVSLGASPRVQREVDSLDAFSANAPEQLFSFALSRAETEALDALERGRRYMAPELFSFLWA